MKEHLIDLLFEECKLRYFVDRICVAGIDIDGLQVENHEIILDMIGFPKDNKRAYERKMVEEKVSNYNMDELPEGYYSREKLIDHYYDTVLHFSFFDSLQLTEDGLTITKEKDQQELLTAISQHINWLYDEYNTFSKNRPVVA